MVVKQWSIVGLTKLSDTPTVFIQWSNVGFSIIAETQTVVKRWSNVGLTMIFFGDVDGGQSMFKL